MTIKVGSLVGWNAVPDGALVLESDGCVCVRHGNQGRLVWDPEALASSDLLWDWLSAPEQAHVTILALDLTGQESEAELLQHMENRIYGVGPL